MITPSRPELGLENTATLRKPSSMLKLPRTRRNAEMLPISDPGAMFDDSFLRKFPRPTGERCSGCRVAAMRGGAQFAVHDGPGARHEDAVYLYE